MEQDPIQLNRQAYDRIAGQFAARIAPMDAELVERVRRFIAGLQPGDRILDIGCGAGRDLAWFMDNGAGAVGADLSMGMLMEARRVARSSLCQMEMGRLGFASGSFAGVWCNAALLHVPKQVVPNVLEEIVRVLAPGGHFFMSVQKGSSEGLEHNPEAQVTRFFTGWQAPEMVRVLAQAGFAILRQDEHVFGRTWLWFETAYMS